MKKTLLLFSMLVTSIVCIYTSHEKSNSTKGMTMLQTANIEALANNESISNTGQLRKRNAMVEAIKWYAVALIQIRVLERIAIEYPIHGHETIRHWY